MKKYIILLILLVVAIEIRMFFSYMALPTIGKIAVYVDGCERTGGFRYCQPEFIYILAIERDLKQGLAFDYDLYLSYTDFPQKEKRKRVLKVLNIFLRTKRITLNKKFITENEFPDYVNTYFETMLDSQKDNRQSE